MKLMTNKDNYPSNFNLDKLGKTNVKCQNHIGSMIKQTRESDKKVEIPKKQKNKKNKKPRIRTIQLCMYLAAGCPRPIPRVSYAFNYCMY